MKHGPLRPHRFPPLSQVGAIGRSGADAFQAGLDRGFAEGHGDGLARGLAEGRAAGHAEGLSQGLNEGREAGRRELLNRFDDLGRPLESAIEQLQQLQHDYQSALRRELVELVARVARQVIRCELALQPVQLLALVDETLATMPPTREGVEVHLNPADLQRIQELGPQRAAAWRLIPDPAMEPGECRVHAGRHEADAGCRQRLAGCVEQVSQQLLGGPTPPAVAAALEAPNAAALSAVAAVQAAAKAPARRRAARKPEAEAEAEAVPVGAAGAAEESAP